MLKHACLLQTRVLLCGFIKVQFNVFFVLNPRSRSVGEARWLKAWQLAMDCLVRLFVVLKA